MISSGQRAAACGRAGCSTLDLLYLGSPFTSDGSVSPAIKVHAQNKLCQVLKFMSFIRKNNDTPFIVKRRLFDAALISALL